MNTITPKNHFAHLPLTELLRPEGHPCACGRRHTTDLRGLFLGAGALNELPQALTAAGCKKPFVVSDAHTDVAAGIRIRALLQKSSIPYVSYISPNHHAPLEPDERTMGALCMAFDPDCDAVLAVGSGVINDCCKTLAHAVRVPCLVVATAPSMDGYASDNASMILNHIKVSLYNACPVVIIADTDILAAAPEEMLRAGVGDMLAKYISVCEWRISALVTGEYYCENIADMMRTSLAKIRKHADGLIRRDAEAISHVMEGLVLSGVAMGFAKISRPAAGVEHYFSHLWVMKALRGACPLSLHGVQVGVGTCLTLKLYDHIRNLKPDERKAKRKMAEFSQEAWERRIRTLFDEETAQSVMEIEKSARKNDPEKHARRLEKCLVHWEEIQRIIAEELPFSAEIITLMQQLGMATTPEEIGLTRQDAVDAFLGSREIRDKYLTSTLLWDLGELEDFGELL